MNMMNTLTKNTCVLTFQILKLVRYECGYVEGTMGVLTKGQYYPLLHCGVKSVADPIQPSE